MTDETTIAVQAGVAAADNAAKPGAAQEKADVLRWLKRITRARAFDEEARKQYAIDRRYARGDTGGEVSANLVGTFIDILAAFLYARNPDVDIRPARCMEPPSVDALRDTAEAMVQGNPAMQAELAQRLQAMTAQYAQTTATGLQLGMVPGAPPTMATALEAMVQEQAEQLRKRYAQRQRDAKAFAETLEIVVARLWTNGKLKGRALSMVRSALTIAPGWLKASWQERTAADPQVLHQVNDLKDNIAKVVAQRQAMEDATGAQLDELRADYERQLAAIEGKVERVVARGFAIDFVPAEDITVAEGVPLADYLDAPWISHRVPMLAEDAIAEFRLTEEQGKKLTRYAPRKPCGQAKDSPALVGGDIDAHDADAFVASNTAEVGDSEYVMIHEIWDRTSNAVLTAIEGLEGWAKPAFQPSITSRWYGFFLLAIGTADGQRHPQSLVTRSAKLIDEYNRIGTAEANHRRRVLPKTLFNEGVVGADAVTKVVTSQVGEFVGVQTMNPNANVSDVFMPLQYPQIDPGLYDRSRIVGELERIWGTSEALQGSVTTTKTATEAEIEHTGFQARSGSRRDALEDVLSDLAQYTAEVAWQHMSADDARAMAGPDAMWPAWSGAESLDTLVNVDIRAGSSGKPNTAAERQAWATLLPLLQSSIGTIAQLRQSDPQATADSLEELLRITVERSGDRLDIDQLVPQAGATTPVAGGMPGAPASAPGAPPAPMAGAPTDPTTTPDEAPLPA